MAVFMASALISARFSQQKKDFTEENEDIVGYISGIYIHTYIYIYTLYVYTPYIYMEYTLYIHYIHTIYILYIYMLYTYISRTLEHQQNNMTFWCVWETCFSWDFNKPTVYTPNVHVFFLGKYAKSSNLRIPICPIFTTPYEAPGSISLLHIAVSYREEQTFF